MRNNDCGNKKENFGTFELMTFIGEEQIARKIKKIIRKSLKYVFVFSISTNYN